jgi:hypothetical protein
VGCGATAGPFTTGAKAARIKITAAVIAGIMLPSLNERVTSDDLLLLALIWINPNGAVLGLPRSKIGHAHPRCSILSSA